MAAKRISGTAIDWTRFTQMVPKHERANFNAFKAKHDGYMLRMLSYPETAPSIDFNSYRNRVANPEIVDKLEKAYKSVQISYPKDTRSHEVDTQQKQSKINNEELLRTSALVIEEALKMRKKFEIMIPYADMTKEEWTLTFPDWSIRWQRPTMFPHWQTVPGLSKEEQKEYSKIEEPPKHTVNYWGK